MNKIKLILKMQFLLLLAVAAGCVAIPPSRSFRIESEQFRMSDAKARLSKLTVPYKERILESRFGPTYALEFGQKDAPVMVLVHAMGMNNLTWAPNITDWAKNYHIFAIDTIGDQGKSLIRRDYPENGKEFALWLNDVIESAGIKRCFLIGNSMGGWISLSTALEFPDKFDALVLISPAAGFPIETRWWDYLENIIFTSSEEKHRESARFLLGNGPSGRDWEDYVVRMVRDMESAKMGIPHDYSEEYLSKLAVPALILVGDNEVVYKNKEDLFKLAKKIIPDIQTDWIPEAGHMGQYDNPVFVNKRVRDFIDNVNSAETN